MEFICFIDESTSTSCSVYNEFMFYFLAFSFKTVKNNSNFSKKNPMTVFVFHSFEKKKPN